MNPLPLQPSRVAIAIAACVALAGCPKKDQGTGTDASVIASPSPTPDSSADAGAGTGAKPTRGGSASTFAGKYTLTAGTLYIPTDKDWASVKFKNDDKTMLGDGEISIAIDAAGRASGSTETGPLGAAVLDGRSEGGILTGTIRRKYPTDNGLTGTLVAKVEADSLVGTMKLAEGNAAVLRAATLTAARK